MSMMTPDIRATEVDEGYETLETLVRLRLGRQTGPLFTTDAAERLFGVYLSQLPEAKRQHYNCRCCGNFLTRFGGLITLTQNGQRESAVFDRDVPAFFQAGVNQIHAEIQRAKITGVFLSSDPIFGTPKSPKGWTHLHAENAQIFKSKLLTADQRAAELREDYGLVQRTIQEYPLEVVENAVKILNSGTFVGEEKGRKIAEWYLNMLRELNPVRDHRMREGIVWFNVATAPPGFTHLKNGMVGTLLDDLNSGRGFTECQRAWTEKMNPRQYRRPNAPVNEGQIANAEKTVEALGITNSLRRRHARLDELPNVIWLPVAEEVKATGGVFGHLLPKTKTATPIAIPNRNMSWTVFQRDVLPNMNRLEVRVPSFGRFMGMLTAVDPEAPPIIQWDLAEARNPVSYYVYIDGSHALHWNTTAGWHDVPLLCRSPHGDKFSQHEDFLFIPIKGARDTRSAGLALFPVILKSELRQVEKVIEHFSNKGTLEGVSEVGGLVFDRKSRVELRVNGTDIITLDRWE